MSVLDRNINLRISLMDYVEMNYEHLSQNNRDRMCTYRRRLYGPALIGNLYIQLMGHVITHAEWWPANTSVIKTGIKVDIPAPEDLNDLIGLEQDCASGKVYGR